MTQHFGETPPLSNDGAPAYPTEGVDPHFEPAPVDAAAEAYTSGQFEPVVGGHDAAITPPTTEAGGAEPAASGWPAVGPVPGPRDDVFAGSRDTYTKDADRHDLTPADDAEVGGGSGTASGPVGQHEAPDPMPNFYSRMAGRWDLVPAGSTEVGPTADDPTPDPDPVPPAAEAGPDPEPSTTGDGAHEARDGEDAPAGPDTNEPANPGEAEPGPTADPDPTPTGAATADQDPGGEIKEEPPYGRPFVEPGTVDPDAPTTVDPVWRAAHDAALARVEAVNEAGGAAGAAQIPGSAALDHENTRDDEVAGIERDPTESTLDRAERDEEEVAKAADDDKAAREREVAAEIVAGTLTGVAAESALENPQVAKLARRGAQGGFISRHRPSTLVHAAWVRGQTSSLAGQLELMKKWRLERGKRFGFDAATVAAVSLGALAVYGIFKGVNSLASHNNSVVAVGGDHQSATPTPEVTPSHTPTPSTGETIPSASGTGTGEGTGVGAGTGDPRVAEVKPLPDYDPNTQDGTIWKDATDYNAQLGEPTMTAHQHDVVDHYIADLSGVSYDKTNQMPNGFPIKLPTKEIWEQLLASAAAFTVVPLGKGFRNAINFLTVAEAKPENRAAREQ